MPRSKAKIDPMTLGGFIKGMRERLNWSKADLARAMGVAWTTVNDWELHGAIPGPQALSGLAEKFKLTDTERKTLHDLAGAAQGTTGATTSDLSLDSTAVGVALAPAERSALEMLLTRSLQPERHALSDALAVLNALADASPLVAEFGLSDAAARAWLDAAAWLRARGAKVTAAALAVLVAQRLAALERVAKGSDDGGDVREAAGREYKTGPREKTGGLDRKGGEVRRLKPR